MLKTLLVLFGVLQSAEIVRNIAAIPLPAPVIGLFALALTLGIKGEVDSQLSQTSSALIDHMGLLFVPAGVGIVSQFELLQQQWMPIIVAVLVSTILGVAVTGAVMHCLIVPAPKTPSSPG